MYLLSDLEKLQLVSGIKLIIEHLKADCPEASKHTHWKWDWDCEGVSSFIVKLIPPTSLIRHGPLCKWRCWRKGVLVCVEATHMGHIKCSRDKRVPSCWCVNGFGFKISRREWTKQSQTEGKSYCHSHCYIATVIKNQNTTGSLKQIVAETQQTQ